MTLASASERARTGNGGGLPARRGRRERPTTVAVDSVRRLMRALRVASRSAERRAGLSGAQLLVLDELAGAPAASLNDLARRTHTDQSSVSVVVSRLVARGLVSREPSIVDGRRVAIALTAPGRAILRRAPRSAQARLVAALERLPRGELAALAHSLQAVVRTLESEVRAQRGEPRGTDAPLSPRR